MSINNIFYRLVYSLLGRTHILDLISDKAYLKLLYRVFMQKKLNLVNPVTFNEKLQWLKLNDHNPLYTTLVDKYAVKDWVSKTYSPDIVIPTLGVWDRIEDIEWDKLPEQFVLKTTHSGDSLGVVICKDKTHFDKTAAIKKLQKSLEKDYYKAGREWPYKNVRRRIIAEEYIEDINGELHDYKFFCFNGIVRFFKIDYGRYTQHKANYYDRNGIFLDCGEVQYHGCKDDNLVIPVNLSEMISIAEILAKKLPFVRVDLYNLSGKIYLGELTFFPAGGLAKYYPEGFCEKIGGLLDLSKLKK